MTLNSIRTHKQLAVTFFAITAFAVGCERSAEQDRKATTEQINQVQAKTAVAAQDMKDYTYTQKDEFVAKMQSQMAEINRDLDQLMERADKSKDEVKAETKPKIQALRDQAAKLNQKLDEAKNATESSWNDVKTAVKKGFGELKEGFQNARQWVSDKIAP